MQSVSDDDLCKRLLEKPCFELAVKGVFRLASYIYTIAKYNTTLHSVVTFKVSHCYSGKISQNEISFAQCIFKCK